MALSGLCLVHCLLLPLLLAAVPTGWLESGWFHAALIARACATQASRRLAGRGVFSAMIGMACSNAGESGVWGSGHGGKAPC
jgi:hypothetical protein